jgi:eukaryotic-like serine/threonine-protein kinase
MPRFGDDASWAELDVFVRAYEQAYMRDHRANFADFLPPPDHPLYAAVLSELVRVDLEYGWERGRPTSLRHYLERYPDLERDQDVLRAIVFEEFRLRRQAGEQPCAREYERLYGERIVAGLSRATSDTEFRRDRPLDFAGEAP